MSTGPIYLLPLPLLCLVTNHSGVIAATGFSLPSACMTYSNVDAYSKDLSALNVTGGNEVYNPRVPAPYATYSEQKARCHRGLA